MEGSTKSVIYLWPGRILFFRNRLNTEAHAHGALAVVVSLDHPFTLRTQAETFAKLHAAIVYPNTHHQSIGQESRLVVVAVDPQSSKFDGDNRPPPGGGIVPLPRPPQAILQECASIHHPMNPSRAWEMTEMVLGLAQKDPESAGTDMKDPVMQRIVDQLREELPEGVLLADLESRHGLSGDRIMRRFKKYTGLPIRQYLLWLRILQSLKHLKDGHDLTYAACESGFADAAHMSRTFKRFFGFTPSVFFGKTRRQHDIVFCDPWPSGT